MTTGLMCRVAAVIGRPFKAQARFLASRLDGEAQMAIGSACTDSSIPLFVVGFFVNEPFLVFQMSAAALFFTGLGFIASGQAIMQAEEGASELKILFKRLNARLDELEGRLAA